jgi:hypothetical protein
LQGHQHLALLRFCGTSQKQWSSGAGKC